MSSPEPRLTSSPVFTPGHFHFSGESRPVTPDSIIRNRFSNPREATPVPGDASPTSTTLSNLSRSVFRATLPMTTSSSFGTPGHKVTIRADPSLVTCFDPIDKELYDLWAPKR
ncbi:hypothetical protein AcV7_003378 [Taiwanofungus camphoratus]|nr:hypothetical protein AcV7_003378 [Antrodia cinnamomea]